MVKQSSSASKKIQNYLNKQQKSKDFDIENEDLVGKGSSDDDDVSDEDDEHKKEHYVSVGKSKIREALDAKKKNLARTQEGKKVSRKDLYGESNADSVSEDHSSSDEEYHSVADEQDGSESDASVSQNEESGSQNEESGSESEESESDDDQAAQPMSTYAQFNQLQSKDAIKGKSIVKQHKQFDSILDIRMQLQKAMTVYNSEYSNTNLDAELLEIARENNNLLKELITELNKKRLHLHREDHFTTKSYDVDSTTNYKKVTKKLNHTLERYNKVTLSKWSKKTLQADHDLLEHLDNVLLDKHKLLTQLRQPKFNDLQFYKNLLNQLIQQKLSNTNMNTNGAASKPVEIRLIKKDNSGSKSSKGRKLDYTVQQKLLNFETPNTNKKMWDDLKRDEFFVGLFGRKVDFWSMDQEDESSSEQDENMEMDEAAIANDELKIFG